MNGRKAAKMQVVSAAKAVLLSNAVSSMAVFEVEVEVEFSPSSSEVEVVVSVAVSVVVDVVVVVVVVVATVNSATVISPVATSLMFSMEVMPCTSSACMLATVSASESSDTMSAAEGMSAKPSSSFSSSVGNVTVASTCTEPCLSVISMRSSPRPNVFA